MCTAASNIWVLSDSLVLSIFVRHNVNSSLHFSALLSTKFSKAGGAYNKFAADFTKASLKLSFRPLHLLQIFRRHLHHPKLSTTIIWHGASGKSMFDSSQVSLSNGILSRRHHIHFSFFQHSMAASANEVDFPECVAPWICANLRNFLSFWNLPNKNRIFAVIFSDTLGRTRIPVENAFSLVSYFTTMQLASYEHWNHRCCRYFFSLDKKRPALDPSEACSKNLRDTFFWIRMRNWLIPISSCFWNK